MAILAAGCAGMPKGQAALSGSQEAPPVTTNATGTTDISAMQSRCKNGAFNCPTLYGSVAITGMTATAAHVHMAPAGQNGPVVAPLVQTSPTVWTIPQDTTITNDQWEAWFNGGLYVNVHSAANPGGEIRAQLSR